jgi:hypothetical protein
MRILASDRKLVEMTANDGPIHKRAKDGTFHVDDRLGRSMVKSSEWAEVGTNFQGTQGFVCTDCGRVSVIRDHCGKCGGTNLEPEG